MTPEEQKQCAECRSDIAVLESKMKHLEQSLEKIEGKLDRALVLIDKGTGERIRVLGFAAGFGAAVSVLIGILGAAAAWVLKG